MTDPKRTPDPDRQSDDDPAPDRPVGDEAFAEAEAVAKESRDRLADAADEAADELAEPVDPDEEQSPEQEELEAAAAVLTESGVADKVAAGELEPTTPVETTPEQARARRRPKGRAERMTAAVTAPGAETLPYVDDRLSKVWVVLIAVVFGLLFLNALFLGQGGFITATPSPSPSPSETPIVSPSSPAAS